MSGCRIVVVPPFDSVSYAQIEAEVLQSFNRSDIVTPDEVRGGYSTLAEAVLTDSRYILVPTAGAPAPAETYIGPTSAHMLLLFMPCLLSKFGPSYGLSRLCKCTQNTACAPVCCSGPGWPALDNLWGKLFLVWTPESFHDYLNLYPNLENALCFVSSVDGNSGDDGGTTVTDPAGVFIQTYDGLSWSSPVTADEVSSFDARVRSLTYYSSDQLSATVSILQI